MQPGESPNDDIHTVLSRFTAWAGDQSENGHANGKQNGAAPEMVREIPYDEAIRRYHTRQSAQKGKHAPAALVRDQLETTQFADPPAAATPPFASSFEAEALTSAVLDSATAAVANSAPAPAKKLKPKTVTRKSPAAPAPKACSVRATKAIARKRSPFREVLERTVDTAAAPARTDADRTRRISIRLSPCEEQRLRESAATAGLTVSAYLRERALGAEQNHTNLQRNAMATAIEEAKPSSGLAAPRASRRSHRMPKWLAGLRQWFAPAAVVPTEDD